MYIVASIRVHVFKWGLLLGEYIQRSFRLSDLQFGFKKRSLYHTSLNKNTVSHYIYYVNSKRMQVILIFLITVNFFLLVCSKVRGRFLPLFFVFKIVVSKAENVSSMEYRIASEYNYNYRARASLFLYYTFIV